MKLQKRRISHLLGVLLLTFLMSLMISTSAFAADAVEKSLQAPRNLKAVGKTYQSIELSWTPVSNVSGYHVYVGTTANGYFKKIAAIKGSSAKKVTLSGIIPGRKYFFKVLTYKGTEKSPFSSTITGKSLETVPAITGISAGVKTISLKWKPVANAASYHIFRAKGTGSPVDIKTVSAATTSFCDTNLTPGTNYKYFIRVSYKIKDNNYLGTRSAVRSIKTQNLSYKILYKQFLQKYQTQKFSYTCNNSRYNTTARRFVLLNLNNDSIPELVVTSTAAGGNLVDYVVFTVKNNRVLLCGATRMRGNEAFAYYSSQYKSLVTYGWTNGNGGSWNRLNALQNDRLVAHKYSYGDSRGTHQICYTANGKPANVTTAAFNYFNNTYFKNYTQYAVRANTAANRDSILK